MDEMESIGIVFADAGSDSQHVGVENDIFGWKALPHQEVVGALSHSNLTFKGVGLPLLVKEHDDDSGPITTYQVSFFQKGGFAFLQTDGVDNGLTLSTFQTSFQHLPFG